MYTVCREEARRFGVYQNPSGVNCGRLAKPRKVRSKGIYNRLNATKEHIRRGRIANQFSDNVRPREAWKENVTKKGQPATQDVVQPRVAVGDARSSYRWRGAIAWGDIDTWVSNETWMNAIGGKINEAWMKSVTKEDSARISEVMRDADADVWA